MKSHNKEETVKKYLAVLDQPNFWRLFVDGLKQDTQVNTVNEKNNLREADYGHLFWAAREPNGLNGLRQAAEKLFSSQLSNKLTFEFIKEVHYSAYPFQDYLIINPDYMLQKATIYFGSRDNKYSQFKWIIRRAKKLKNVLDLEDNPWGVTPNFEGKGHEIYTHLSPKKKIAIYNKLVEKYKEDISKENISDKDKLKIIIQFIQDGECIHVFRDGNSRLSYLKLNKELMENGFEPIILADPNDICWKTNRQLINEVKKGQQAYKHFIETGLPYETCVEDAKIAENIKNIDPSLNINSSLIKHELFKSYSYKECLTLIEKIKTSYKEFYEYCITQASSDLNNKDTLINTGKEMVETSEEPDDIPYISKEIKKIWEDYENFIIVQAFFENKGKTLSVEDYHNESMVNFLSNYETAYGSYKNEKVYVKWQSLFDEFTSFKKIYENGFLQNKDASLSEIFADIDSYLDKVQSLCRRYEDIDIESLSNPLLCHLTKTEQEALKVELKQNALSSSYDEVVDLSDEILETSIDVEVFGAAHEITEQ